MFRSREALEHHYETDLKRFVVKPYGRENIRRINRQSARENPHRKTQIPTKHTRSAPARSRSTPRTISCELEVFNQNIAIFNAPPPHTSPPQKSKTSSNLVERPNAGHSTRSLGAAQLNRKNSTRDTTSLTLLSRQYTSSIAARKGLRLTSGTFSTEQRQSLARSQSSVSVTHKVTDNCAAHTDLSPNIPVHMFQRNLVSRHQQPTISETSGSTLNEGARSTVPTSIVTERNENFPLVNAESMKRERSRATGTIPFYGNANGGVRMRHVAGERKNDVLVVGTTYGDAIDQMRRWSTAPQLLIGTGAIPPP